ncbi:DUF481 domain-containing protein [Verrucomicrobia bacterium S94]|nr:DUF481 domain-containing protein [Verrucomicrobia bacterium S94]
MSKKGGNMLARWISGAGFAVLLAGPSSAAGDKDLWDHFVPPPDQQFDWIQLDSGEWLKGEIKVLYNYTLEFDSDELDLLKLDLDDVKKIRSCDPQEIMFEIKRRETEVLQGIVELDGSEVKVINDSEVQTFKRSQLVSIAGGSNSKRDNWSGSASLGATLRGGNTETLDITAMVNIKRRTAASRFNMDYIGNYSEVETSDKDTEKTAGNHRLSVYADWFLTGRFYWRIVDAEYYSDEFVNISDQVSLATGIGYDVIRTARTEWTANAGGGYQETGYDEVVPPADENSGSAFGTIGTRLDYEVTGDVDLIYDYTARFLSRENGRYTHHMVATLSYEIIHDLDLDISLIWDRMEDPEPVDDGVGGLDYPEQDDYQMVIGIGYSF